MSHKPEFASAKYTAGELNAVVKLLRKQAGEDGVERFLRGELTVSEPTRFLRDEPSVSEPIRSWREENRVIYFSVTSDGTTGEDWIKRLEGSGFRVGDHAKQVLLSKDFKSTSGVTTEVAVLKGMYMKDDDRITKKIRAEADWYKFSKPNAELACLTCLKFTDKEIEAMGLWYIVAMHEHINDSGGVPSLLSVERHNGGRGLYACGDGADSKWIRSGGFAFAVCSN